MKDSHVLVFVGEECSGKSLGADIFKDIYSTLHPKKGCLDIISYNDVVGELISSSALAHSMKNDEDFVSGLMQDKGEDFLGKIIIERVNESKSDRVVVEGIRFWIEYLILKIFPVKYVIYITAPANIRYKRKVRYVNENNGRFTSFLKFCEASYRPYNRDIPWIGTIASNYIITNDGSIEDLITKLILVEEVMLF